MTEVRCGSCHEQVPSGRFCLRCGAVLPGLAGASEAPLPRRGFAAAPHQRLNSPRLTSTLFPHLPRRSMHGFRISLAAGTLIVVALAGLGLFGAALITAAALVPGLTLLYLYDVNVYEDEPLRILALTLIAGTAAGVLVGLLARSTGDGGAAIITASPTRVVVVDGLLLPLLGVAMMLVGPVILLRYRRFNDVLDGVSFGATTAAAFGGALAVTHSASILGAGTSPGGLRAPWALRLLAGGVALPVLTMAAMGIACAALWLRFRAPVRDRGALGRLGDPALAVPVAALAIVAGSALETLVSVGWWLAGLAVLDAVALVSLRRAVHLGLVEEALELPVGAAIECANCGGPTPRHKFCLQCGIALQALPKPGAAQRRAQPLDHARGAAT